MKRRHLSEEELLAEIGKNAGSSTKRIASQLLEFADEVGARKEGRHNSISVRYRLLGRAERQWLTLFVVTTAGTFYCGWLYRWHQQGFPKRIEHDYEKQLESVLNRPVVHGIAEFHEAVPLREIHRKWTAVRRVVRLTVDKLRLSESQHPVSIPAADVSAIEGLATEGKATRYGRSRSLREAAMLRSVGICAVCRNDFKKVLGGRGICVLHVHHVKQLSARDKPNRTTLKDLVVVCANCHMLLHFVDRGRPLLPSDLRARLRNS
jgi:hypothetical protein